MGPGELVEIEDFDCAMCLMSVGCLAGLIDKPSFIQLM